MLALLALTLAACSPRDEHFESRYGQATPFVSAGERIYFTAIGSNGYPIASTGGRGMAGMHQRMHGGGCASCHGADREGGRQWPQFWIKAPALTPAALFGGNHDDDGHDDHGAYDAGTLRRAITRGLDPAGKPLDTAMPRWQMSATDLDDLIAYLQQTHEHD